MLKSQDIVVGLQVHLWRGPEPWTYARIGAALGLSASQVHTGVGNLTSSGLYWPDARSLRARAFADFARFGVPHVFPARLGPLSQGIPTAHSALPLRAVLRSGEDYVWPVRGGAVRGRGVVPLHGCCLRAARSDSRVHGALALLDSFRLGRPREIRLAVDLFDDLLADPESLEARGLLTAA